MDYINADEIKKNLKCSDYEAAELAEMQREKHLQNMEDFCFETVMGANQDAFYSAVEAVKNLVSMNFRLSLIRIRYVKFFCRIYVFYGVELLLLCYSITI